MSFSNQDIPVITISAGNFLVSGIGIYVYTGSAAVVGTVADSSLADNCMHFWAYNRGSASVTFTPVFPVSNAFGAGIQSFILESGTSVFIVFDGTYFKAMFLTKLPLVREVVALTGASTVLLDTASSVINLLLNPAGTIATYAVTLPLNAFAGQRVVIATTKAITALTITGNAITGNVTSLPDNGFVSYTWGGTFWYRTG